MSAAAAAEVTANNTMGKNYPLLPSIGNRPMAKGLKPHIQPGDSRDSRRSASMNTGAVPRNN